MSIAAVSYRRSYRRLLAVLTLLCLFASSVASALSLKPDAPMSYTVKRGDTLWDISGRYLSSPWHWDELWQANPDIANPHLIYPGDVLSLRWQSGTPRLSLASRGDVKLSPRLRSEPLDAAIPAIPRDQIDPFLRSNRILEPGLFETLPYLIAGDAKRIVSGLGDRVYGRGPIDAQNRTLDVVRKDRLILDPSTQEVLGLQVSQIGTVSLQAPESAVFTDSEVKTFEVTRMQEEIRISDRLIASTEGVLDAVFQPKAPDIEVKDGFMVAVDGGVTQIGQMDIVTLNRGQRDGLLVGDVLAIMQTGEVVVDPVTGEPVSLPDERAGVLMVFATFEKAAFGLVLTASRPMKVGDKVTNP